MAETNTPLLNVTDYYSTATSMNWIKRQVDGLTAIFASTLTLAVDIFLEQMPLPIPTLCCPFPPFPNLHNPLSLSLSVCLYINSHHRSTITPHSFPTSDQISLYFRSELCFTLQWLLLLWPRLILRRSPISKLLSMASLRSRKHLFLSRLIMM